MDLFVEEHALTLQWPLYFSSISLLMHLQLSRPICLPHLPKIHLLLLNRDFCRDKTAISEELTCFQLSSRFTWGDETLRSEFIALVMLSIMLSFKCCLLKKSYSHVIKWECTIFFATKLAWRLTCLLQFFCFAKMLLLLLLSKKQCQSSFFFFKSTNFWISRA